MTALSLINKSKCIFLIFQFFQPAQLISLLKTDPGWGGKEIGLICAVSPILCRHIGALQSSGLPFHSPRNEFEWVKYGVQRIGEG